MPSKLIEDLSNNMKIICFVNIDQNIIQVNNNKDIQLSYQYFIDISLQVCLCAGKTKWYHLILKMIICGIKSCFSHVFFANSHLVISTCWIKLGKLRRPI